MKLLLKLTDVYKFLVTLDESFGDTSVTKCSTR